MQHHSSYEAQSYFFEKGGQQMEKCLKKIATAAAITSVAKWTSEQQGSIVAT